MMVKMKCQQGYRFRQFRFSSKQPRDESNIELSDQDAMRTQSRDVKSFICVSSSLSALLVHPCEPQMLCRAAT